MCAIMYVHKIIPSCLCSYDPSSNCTQPENAEGFGILKCTCQSDEEVSEISLEDGMDLLVQLSEVPRVGIDTIIPPEVLLTG